MLSAYQYSSAAQASSMKALQAQGETVPEMLAAASKLGLVNDSKTADGVMKAKAARSFIA